MKFFAIYTTLEFLGKPAWFDRYREKYDVSYDPHITLTQPCYVEESRIRELKDSVADFFANNKISSIELTFDKKHLDREDEGGNGCIMIAASKCAELIDFQKKLNRELHNFKSYTEPKYQEYEENFKPHVTIARDLSQAQFDQALAELPENYTIRARFPEAILAIVSDKSEKERKDPKNLTTYKL